MPKIAGFHCEIDRHDGVGQPLVLLHGSGQDETCWGDIAEKIAPHSPAFRVRGNIIWEGKFAFFRRKPDRSLDMQDLARSVEEIAFLLTELHALCGNRKPIMLGYSNGAICATAVMRDFPLASAGSILLRPVPLPQETVFALSPSYPVLIISGETDSRRKPDDGARLADQLNVAETNDVTCHTLNCGHGWDTEGRDVAIARQWFAQRFE
ncbi:hypothetical protein [Rhizobium sp.]|jgi:phospholipase/carboxylesterase|uniref:alpha/beta hydrolase n=1 Tax=Rhizobium sp. TaxID=391 RepID=UPI002AA7DAB5